MFVCLRFDCSVYSGVDDQSRSTGKGYQKLGQVDTEKEEAGSDSEGEGQTDSETSEYGDSDSECGTYGTPGTQIHHASR